MANILMFSDQTKSHLIPTFKIAQNLERHNYQLAYIGARSVVQAAAKMGFKTYTPFEGIREHPISYILKGGLDPLMRKIDPKMIILTAHSPLEALACYYRYGIKTVLIWSFFPIGETFDDPEIHPYRDKAKGFALEQIKKVNPIVVNEIITFAQQQGKQIRTLADLVSGCEAFGHFITCSKELLNVPIPERPDEIYLGPSLSDHNVFQDKTGQFRWERPQNKKVIFCSMGSWADEINAERAFGNFRAIFQAMQDPVLTEFHLFVAAGNLHERLKLLIKDSRISVHRWLPQTQLLKHADLAIIHGGMGSVKECIQEEVPMIIMPLGLDQFENAGRVAFHQIGVAIENTASIPIRDLASRIRYTAENEVFKTRLGSMKAVFDRDASEHREVKYVDQCLNRKVIKESFITI